MRPVSNLAREKGNKSVEVSVVIPTLNRTKDLKELLLSIFGQTKTAREVVVVDDSDNDETRDLAGQLQGVFSEKRIFLRYLRGGGGDKKSISSARNLGAAQSSGDIVFFIDDDVVLRENYIEKIVDVYERYPQAMGVQGYLGNQRISILSNSIKKVFFLFHEEKNSCRLLPSGTVTYPYILDRVISCEWLSGTNSSYRRAVLRDFRFDENLREYSLGEDKTISSRILKRYPNSLFMTPHARVVHKVSSTARRDLRWLTYAGTLYPAYFFGRYMKKTLLNRMIFAWSTFGRFLTTLLGDTPQSTLHLIGSYIFMLKHLDEVKNGNFASLNR